MGPRLGALPLLTGLSLLAMTPAASAQTAPPAVVHAPAALNYLEQQTSTQRLATSYIGKNVYGPDNQKIGDINDVVVDTAVGSGIAVVIGVGGLLGLGEKDVAVPINALKMETREGRRHWRLEASSEDLRKAPAFKRSTP